MSMMRPTGHRVLVKPDEAEMQTPSGLFVPDSSEVLPVSGTVTALGPGGHRGRYQARQRAVDACIQAYLNTEPDPTSMREVLPALKALRGTCDPVREIAVGARVVFPIECGFAITYDGEAYLLVDEDDCAVVIEEVAHVA